MIKPRSRNEKPASILEKANEWMEETRLDVKNYNFPDLKGKARVYKIISDYEDNCNLMFKTIFKSAGERKTYIDDGLKKDMDDRLGINIPQAIIYLIFSLLHDGENMALIEQAKKKFK